MNLILVPIKTKGQGVEVEKSILITVHLAMLNLPVILLERSVLSQVRQQSTQIKAPFKSNRVEMPNKRVNFDRNMPAYVPKKAWERDGQDKEKWFKRKHAHHHILEKPHREQMEQRYEGIERKKRRERMEYVRQDEETRYYKDVLKQRRSNALIDHLFGTNAVLAALKSNKRKRFGKLYLHSPKDTDKFSEIMELAKELNINVKDSTKQELNILTDNAVHNGIVLETRPMEIETIKSMGSEVTEDNFSVRVLNDIVGDSSTEEIAVNSYGKRFPLGLYLDEISDPHNVGAILRSAYFLGVDFVVFSERNCAPLSPVVAKSSSGAIEFSKLFKVGKPLTFFDESKKNGWVFISTVAPNDSRNKSKQVDTDFISDILQKSPVILVVGSEGTGIRTNLINKSEYLVAVTNGREMNECVDSLNVSVATALLISKILV